MKVISFCLYGNQDIYLKGIIEAVISYKLIFINWDIFIYVPTNFEFNNILNILTNLQCKIFFIDYLGQNISNNIEPMFWRFLPLENYNIDFFISRDADSRASLREYKMIKEWMDSNKLVHSILDQRCHHNLMGGMCGFNLKLFKKDVKISEIIKQNLSNNIIYRGKDQTFISNFFKDDILNKNILIHICDDKECKEKCTIFGLKYDNFPYILTNKVSNFIGRKINITNLNNRPFININFSELL